MNIKVLGTRFNVSSYPESSIEGAVLVEGKVEVSTNSGNRWSTIQMEPCQRLVVNKSNNRFDVVSNVRPEIYTSWKDNKMVFHDSPMGEVAQTLERWFNVVVILKGSEIKSYTYTGKFENRSLNQVLKFIELSAPIAFEIEKDTITLKSRYR